MTAVVDLHVHTSKSYDSVQTPKMVARYAEKAGLDAIAITDHSEFGAHKNVREVTHDDLTVIPGMEVRTVDYDDLLAIGITDPISNDRFRPAVEEIQAQGGVAILPHPYRKVSEFPSELIRSVDAIETLNARSKVKNNTKSSRLTEDYNVSRIGSSDAHTPWEIGRARTQLSVNRIQQSDILDAIRKGNSEPIGTTSPYYVFHGFSVAMEVYKSIRR